MCLAICCNTHTYIYIVHSIVFFFFQVLTNFISASFHIPFHSWSTMTTKREEPWWRNLEVRQLCCRGLVEVKLHQRALRPANFIPQQANSKEKHLQHLVSVTWGCPNQLLWCVPRHTWELQPSVKKNGVWGLPCLFDIIKRWLHIHRTKRPQTVLQGTWRDGAW